MSFNIFKRKKRGKLSEPELCENKADKRLYTPNEQIVLLQREFDEMSLHTSVQMETLQRELREIGFQL